MVGSDSMNNRNGIPLIQEIPEIPDSLEFTEISEVPDIQGRLHEICIADASQDPIASSAKSHSSRTAATVQNPIDWTLDIPETEHVQLFRATDWAATPLGPLESWGLALRLHTFTTFSDTRPACLYWGPERVAIYNEHFIIIAGKTHPTLMGKPFEVSLPEIWNDIRGLFIQAEITKVAADVNEISLMLERGGYKEETYFTGSFNPVRREDGTVGGFYNFCFEVTKEKLNERRLNMLSELEMPTGLQQRTFASHVMPHLKSNPLDIPMAMLYQVDEQSPSGSTVYLRGQIGFPDHHPLAVQQAELSSCLALFPLLCEARNGIFTHSIDERFAGVHWCGHKDEFTGIHEPSTHFSILPLSSADRLFGYLIIAANSRRPIDKDHNQFMKSIASRVSSIASALASAEETRQRANRLERELAESERQIRYMAQNAPVGMLQLSMEGKILWANQMYYELTGHPGPEEPQYNFSFLDILIDEDRALNLQSWARLHTGQSHIETTSRLKRMFVPPCGEPHHAYMLSLAFPYMVNGEVKSIMSCITDISELKWAEASEARNAEEARAAKRQQEEFIDVVSHEMRNPLSAIFQCADMISNSFNDLSHTDAAEILKSNVEAANTIAMCASHQKRIVDDVLTLSKLKYMMLTISPRPARPAGLLGQVTKMFEADLKSHDISIDTVAQPSFRANDIDWVTFDASRVTQILINLLTNAIKFTRGEEKRNITITYGATLVEPQNAFEKEFYWVPCENEVEDLTLHSEWGSGEHVFLTCAVTDTGVGMCGEEIPRLFTRFEQANSKTSIKYGGSGLGLFISQQLTEKQGGRIGLSSKLGEGSTFGFYVKARRSIEPPNTIRPNLTPESSGSSEVSYYDGSKAMQVLLVEDNLVNQKILKKQLTKAGCVVHVANHGLEALEILRQCSCWYEPVEDAKALDIILMDWEMPVMDGLTCSREIRALQQSGKIVRHLEIIAITANAREEQVQLALHNGINFVMSKPFVVSNLLSKMKERLSFIDDGTTFQRRGKIWENAVGIYPCPTIINNTVHDSGTLERRESLIGETTTDRKPDVAILQFLYPCWTQFDRIWLDTKLETLGIYRQHRQSSTSTEWHHSYTSMPADSEV
ncbi:putative histidine kinase M3C8p [Sclerotinia borealis F-4128]|uniref:histidine kinase n=1 Tax=Sclerotinia borealis (strain F-4128) TaxID=1432307 RepID=W9CH45_SCLBF|nr:putative histidine kinase M3C8p [Sclerotinia borealis F-4128]